jgi:hypothetical protein
MARNGPAPFDEECHVKCSRVPLLAVPVLLSAFSAAALAADEPATPPAASLSDVFAASNLTVSGYLDLS